ncbi:hypothetical protein [Nocardioides sp. SYSU DS0663]|uniref:hypothetical protein n=1 Tax=Nocardioides sp. SYSU DS0663 TaxID=3416445 RepID=UPI003F4C4E5D
MSTDQSLGDPTPPDALPAGGAFGNPNAPTDQPTPVRRQLTIEEVLASAKLPEKHARVCLRADLQARHDDLIAQLAAMVNAQGELIEDPEASAADVSAASRAQALNDELAAVRREMTSAMWFPLFRGLSTDELAVFNKRHEPKGDGADMTDYNVQLVAACAVEPTMSVGDVKALRKKLGARAMRELTNTAHEVCARGGVDVPKLPASLLNLTRQ